MKRNAKAVWKGNLAEGTGSLTSQSGAIADMPYSFKGRFLDESGKSGTNPEELIAAAHAGCFAMQLSHFLAENGTPATSLDATATVTVDPDPAGGFTVKGSAIDLVGTVPGIDAAKFAELAEKAKADLPDLQGPGGHRSLADCASRLISGLCRKSRRAARLSGETVFDHAGHPFRTARNLADQNLKPTPRMMACCFRSTLVPPMSRSPKSLKRYSPRANMLSVSL